MHDTISSCYTIHENEGRGREGYGGGKDERREMGVIYYNAVKCNCRVDINCSIVVLWKDFCGMRT
jgi:hypothetical protein